jgi:hypothetical protein
MLARLAGVVAQGTQEHWQSQVGDRQVDMLDLTQPDAQRGLSLPVLPLTPRPRTHCRA